MDDSSINWQAWIEDRKGTRTPIRGACNMGRSAMNQVVIEDSRVSRRHATIQVQGPGEYWLVDFGSSNGTYLNGQRIAQPTRLNEKDVVQLGIDEFVFHKVAGEPAPVSSASVSDSTVFDVRMIDCWMLVADIINSTHLVNELAPGELPLVTGRWLHACREIIEASGGRINQFMGDGFFAFWRDKPDMDHAIVSCIQAMISLQEHARPQFRFVLHLAPVVFGGIAIGEEERISGSEVHYVFRMEKLAGSLGAVTLVSDAVRERLGAVVATREMGMHPLQGFDSEYPFYTLLNAELTGV